MRIDDRRSPRFATCVLVARGDDSALLLGRSLGETLALRAGPPGGQDEALLLRALSLGAGRAVHLWDPALEKTDCSGLATALAAAIRHLGCPLVLTTDRGPGALGPTLADRLDVPHLCGVVDVRLVPGPEGVADGAQQQLLIKRRVRRGVQELRGGVAAVLCVLPQAVTERVDGQLGQANSVPQSAAVTDREARSAAVIEPLDLERLGLRPQELTQRRGMLTPGVSGTAVTPRPVVLDGAQELLRRLQRDGLLRR